MTKQRTVAIRTVRCCNGKDGAIAFAKSMATFRTGTLKTHWMGVAEDIDEHYIDIVKSANETAR